MTVHAVGHELQTGPVKPGQLRPKVVFVDGARAGTPLNVLKRLFLDVTGEDSIPGTLKCTRLYPLLSSHSSAMPHVKPSA